MSRRHDVIILGGGPVGHALALALGLRGVSCALIERHATPVQIPKGQNLTNRSVEHFWFWGCADELRAARTLPPGYATGGITCYDTLITEHWHARGIERQRPVRDYYFQKNERLPQYRTEEVLRARVAQLPNVTTYYGKQARAVSAGHDGVSVRISDAARDGQFFSWSADAQGREDGQTEGADVIEGAYLVGCDGARSMVRDSLQIDRDGQDFDQRMVLAVFRSPQLHAELERYPMCSTYRVLRPELDGYWQFFGRIDLGEGFFFHAPVPRTATRETLDVKALLVDAAGIDFEAEIEHVGFWDLRIRVAQSYGKGRVFIAGDAAHQHPPYGGFGLNTGLEDAVNLAWKLSAKLQGWGGEQLLASYELERRPIIAETTQDIIAAGILSDRDWLRRCEALEGQPGFDAEWQAFGEQLMSYIPTYEPHYDGSPVIWGAQDATTSVHGKHELRARAGHHLAPVGLADGRNVYESLDANFTLLALGARPTDIEAFSDAAQQLGIPLSILSDNGEEARHAYEAALVLVRPDQFVAWSGDKANPDAAEILKRAVGAA